MKELPSEFVKLYKEKRPLLEKALKEIRELLQLRISQLRYKKGVRARITDARVKRPRKVWKKAQEKKLSISEVFRKTEDLLGIRIVCDNLSDIEPLKEMLQNDIPGLKREGVRNYTSNPLSTGYRAVHVRTIFEIEGNLIPCEVQIRTLAQDTWARLSREDLYGKQVPPSIQELAQDLANQLSAIDKTAQLIRDELNKCPPTADKIQDSDSINPGRLKLLYKERYNEDIPGWTLLDWVRSLEEAEVETIGEVRNLLNNEGLRKRLDSIATKIRGFPLENSEWVVYSTIVASEPSLILGIERAKKLIQDTWDEILDIGRSGTLSEMPETLDEFIEMLKSNFLPVEALEELGGMQRCQGCGSEILIPRKATRAILKYYNFSEESAAELESLLKNFPEAEDENHPGFCRQCGQMMNIGLEGN